MFEEIYPEEVLEKITEHLKRKSEECDYKVVVDPEIWKTIPEYVKLQYKDRLFSHEAASGILLISSPKDYWKESSPYVFGEFIPDYPLPKLKKFPKKEKKKHEK